MTTSVALQIFLLLMNIYSSFGDIERSDGKGCTFKFFQSVKKYTHALSSCQSYGGTLGIPDTAVKMTFLHGMLTDNKVTAWYLIGGIKKNDGNYYWEGGARVNTNSYNGYKDKVNEPKHDPMYIRYVVEDKQSFWATHTRSAYYLCQKKDTSVCLKTCSGHGTCVRGDHNLYNCHSITTTCRCYSSYYGSSCQERIKSCSVPSESKTVAYPSNISCDVTAPHFPITTKWIVNGENAVNNSADAVFFNTMKTTTSLTAQLTLKRAKCLGMTKIRLVASNTFGSWNKDIIVNSTYNNITNILAHSPSCKGNTTTLHWTYNVPNHLKQTLQYKITGVDSPVVANDTTYTFRNLTPETAYDITINPFSIISICDGFTHEKKISFKMRIGRPNMTYYGSGTARYKDSFQCEVTWFLNNMHTTSIKLLIDGEINKLGKARTNFLYNENIKINSPKQNGSWIKSLPPNKIYKFRLSLSNCAGEGLSVLVNQTCTTPTTVPEMIPKVTFQSNFITNGKINATVPVISEENGPISCVLVCITIETDPGSNTSLTHAQVTALTTGKGYVAYCLKDVSKPNNITLGNEELTHCTVGETNGRSTSERNNVFIGSNKPLLDKTSYGIFLIAITYSRHEIHFRRSNVTVIGHYAIFLTSSNLLVPAVASSVTVFIVVVILVIIGWNIKKQRMKLNQTQPSTNDVINNTSYENFETDVQPAS